MKAPVSIVAIACLLSLACGPLPYGGKCEEIALGTPVSSLPVESTRQAGATWTGKTGKAVKGLPCTCPDAGGCACVQSSLGPPYRTSACPNGTVTECLTYSEDAGVVNAVFATCTRF